MGAHSRQTQFFRRKLPRLGCVSFRGFEFLVRSKKSDEKICRRGKIVENQPRPTFDDSRPDGRLCSPNASKKTLEHRSKKKFFSPLDHPTGQAQRSGGVGQRHLRKNHFRIFGKYSMSRRWTASGLLLLAFLVIFSAVSAYAGDDLSQHLLDAKNVSDDAATAKLCEELTQAIDTY